jgi:formylglycine-generating enzyme required for sulfatase activity
MKKLLIWMVAMVIACVGVQAGEIMVSWSSNGVLRAEGLEPGTSFTVEWASNLAEGFTNNPAPFEGLLADSNGVGVVAIPMFFRVRGAPAGSLLAGMVLIPAGTNSGTDPDFGEYSLTNESDFYMDATEVTKAQWDEVYDWALDNGYSFSNAGSGKGANHPVHTVNWYDCVKWCNARSEMIGKTPCYTINSSSIYRAGTDMPTCNFDADGYRLPTLDEWKYAARGGLSGKRFPWGDTITHSEANYESRTSDSYDLNPTAGYHPDYNDGTTPYTSPVASFAANNYGLFDMAGNVFEFTWERYVPGGAWDENSTWARCGASLSHSLGLAYDKGGFRTVLPAN